VTQQLFVYSCSAMCLVHKFRKVCVAYKLKGLKQVVKGG